MRRDGEEEGGNPYRRKGELQVRCQDRGRRPRQRLASKASRSRVSIRKPAERWELWRLNSLGKLGEESQAV